MKLRINVSIGAYYISGVVTILAIHSVDDKIVQPWLIAEHIVLVFEDKRSIRWRKKPVNLSKITDVFECRLEAMIYCPLQSLLSDLLRINRELFRLTQPLGVLLEFIVPVQPPWTRAKWEVVRNTHIKILLCIPINQTL